MTLFLRSVKGWNRKPKRRMEGLEDFVNMKSFGKRRGEDAPLRLLAPPLGCSGSKPDVYFSMQYGSTCMLYYGTDFGLD